MNENPGRVSSHSSPYTISPWGAFRGPVCVGDDPLNNSS